MYANKPIIGIAGGIGSGKSHVAKLFGELGCLVIDADALVRQAYQDQSVLLSLRNGLPAEVFNSDGSVDRKALATHIFSNRHDRMKLEGIVHPWVAARRDQIMAAAANDSHVKAFIWDTPLLFESGLHRTCDAIVFVDTTEAERFARVRDTRGWTIDELRKREVLQWPLDKKKEMSNYVLRNSPNPAIIDNTIQVEDIKTKDIKTLVQETFPELLVAVCK